MGNVVTHKEESTSEMLTRLAEAAVAKRERAVQEEADLKKAFINVFANQLLRFAERETQAPGWGSF